MWHLNFVGEAVQMKTVSHENGKPHGHVFPASPNDSCPD
jgi:hypothetical protein